MPKTKTRVWDPAEHLVTEEDMAAYLEAVLQEGDSALIAAALGWGAKASTRRSRSRVTPSSQPS